MPVAIHEAFPALRNACVWRRAADRSCAIRRRRRPALVRLRRESAARSRHSGSARGPARGAAACSANHARAVVALGGGTVPAIGRTLLQGVRLLPAVALVVLLYDLGSFGGLILLIVPGIYLYVRWYVCAQTAVVEGV